MDRFLQAQNEAIMAVSELNAQYALTVATSKLTSLTSTHSNELSRLVSVQSSKVDEMKGQHEVELERRELEWEDRLRTSEASKLSSESEVIKLRRMLAKAEEEKKRMKIKFDQEMYVLKKTKS
mmetsp:Transcript_1953/g.3914  ORF Transcript_1953/g.3914 Transcript_1953/m.3914 type:complete len:123 (+) Transcript_1953:143-511(+)